MRTEPRLTRDADIAVSVADDRDAESLVLGLQGKGWGVVAAIEQDAAGRLATVRLTPAGGSAQGTLVDLLFASSGIEAEIVGSAELLEIVPGLAAPVARVGPLIALKVLARDDRTRPQDRVDLAALLGRADTVALREARESLLLIARRGFHRNRDLLAALDAAMNEFKQE